MFLYFSLFSAENQEILLKKTGQSQGHAQDTGPIGQSTSGRMAERVFETANVQRCAGVEHLAEPGHGSFLHRPPRWLQQLSLHGLVRQKGRAQRIVDIEVASQIQHGQHLDQGRRRAARRLARMDRKIQGLLRRPWQSRETNPIQIQYEADFDTTQRPRDLLIALAASCQKTFSFILEESPLYLDPNEPPACHMGDDRLFWIGQVVN